MCLTINVTTEASLKLSHFQAALGGDPEQQQLGLSQTCACTQKSGSKCCSYLCAGVKHKWKGSQGTEKA